MARICISLPVHESPAVVLDQIENIRAFMPANTLIVLHLSEMFEQQPAEVQRLMPDGVLVNPECLPTAWGDFIQAHLSNIEFAHTQEQFDYVLLQASNDMYVREGAGAYISKHDAAFNSEIARIGMFFSTEGLALNDPALKSMMRDVGATQLVAGQVEGSFYNVDLMSDIIAIVRKHWNHGEGDLYPREEYYFPTLAMQMTNGVKATPIIYTESTHSKITAGHVWRIADGSYRETAESLSHGTYIPEFARYDYDNIYGLKRITRSIDDPMRLMIRGLTRAQAPRMRVPSPLATNDAVVVASLDDLLNHPEGLWLWAYQFRGTDPVALVVVAHESEDTQAKLDLFAKMAQHAGIESTDAANVEVIVVPKDSFVEASLRWSALGRFEMTDPAYRLDDVPVFGPRSLGGLREYARQAGAA